MFVVRKGNPKNITGWDNLVKPGVDVITPNPSTSGSARWNILAAYGAQLKEGKSPAEALAYVKTLLTKNVSVQPSSASSALQTFTSGKGDVLLELPEAMRARGREGRRQRPDRVPEADDPDPDTGRGDGQGEAGRRSSSSTGCTRRRAQKIWAEQGYRPVLPSVAKQYASTFPTPAQLFDIGFLGGWTKVKTESSIRRVVRSRRSSRPPEFQLPPADSYVAARRRRRRRVPPEAAPVVGRAGLGLAMLYMSVIVLIPLAAVTGQGGRTGSGRSGAR